MQLDAPVSYSLRDAATYYRFEDCFADSIDNVGGCVLCTYAVSKDARTIFYTDPGHEGWLCVWQDNEAYINSWLS